MGETDQDNIWNQNRKSLLTTKDKSEDDFEKNLVLITSGTLVLSMTFIEKIAPLNGAGGIMFLIIAWSFLGISLLINLVSHQLSAKYSQNYIEKFDEGVDVIEINKSMSINNNRMRKTNNWSVGLMISGVISLIVYCSINAYKMAKTQSTKSTATIITKAHVGAMKNGRQATALVVPKPIVKPEPSNPKSNKAS